MIIHLNENRFNKFFLITESKNSSRAKSQTLAILAQVFKTEPDNEEVLSTEQEFRKVIFDDLHLTNKEYDRVIKYEPLFMRCALDVGYQLNISFLKRYTDYIIFKTKDSPNPSEVMSRYASANSFMDLYRIVNTDMKADKWAGVKADDDVQYTLNQNYDVLGPLTFDQAQVYGNESGDNGSGRICYTQNEDTWNRSNYSNNDQNKCYLLLRKDWESVPCKHDGSEANNGISELSEYNGYDNYGLSMIFVFIEPNGELHECNTRWNHAAKYGPGRGVDHALNEEDIANLMGAPFEKVFGVKKTYRCAKINERIANGEPVNDLVKAYAITSKNHKNYKKIFLDFGNFGTKFNFMKEDGTVVWDRPVELWFDYVDNFNENGFALVRIGEKWNLLREDGTLVWGYPLEKWFDDIRDFSDKGVAIVVISEKYNFIRTDGTLVWDYPVEKWFDYCFEFKDGIAQVKIGQKFNYLREDGTLVWDYPVEEWFDDTFGFYKGFATVSIGKKRNLLRPDGTLVWDYPLEEWFDEADIFDRNGLAWVCLNEKYNWLKPNGTFLWDYPVEKWFDDIRGFSAKGVAFVKIGEKENFIRKDGTLVWNHPAEEWFDKIDISDFTYTFIDDDLIDVYFKGKLYKLSEDGKLYDENGNFVSESKERKKSLITESKNSSKESGIIYL